MPPRAISYVKKKKVYVSNKQGNIFPIENIEEVNTFNMVTLLFFNNLIYFVEYDVNTNTFTQI